jgi:pimeloyl-ACP methyl ester carboxylesterase
LHLETSGSGHTLLCLHGVGGCALWFKGLAFRLQNRFQVVTLDLPGTGVNRDGLAPFSIEGCADILAEYILKHQKNPISILGHSLGTILALRLATLVPNHLHSFLFAGGLPKITPVSRQRLLERREVILKYGMTGLGWKVAIGNFSKNSLNENPESLAMFAGLWERQSQIAYLEGIDSLLTGSAENDLKHVKLPCLIVRGSEDSYAPLAESLEFIGSLPGPTRFVELEKCAHMSFLESPTAFTAAVMSFLDSTW